jgi:hypothetical protein
MSLINYANMLQFRHDPSFRDIDKLHIGEGQSNKYGHKREISKLSSISDKSEQKTKQKQNNILPISTQSRQESQLSPRQNNMPLSLRTAYIGPIHSRLRLVNAESTPI